MSQSKPESMKIYLQIRNLFERLTKNSENHPLKPYQLILSMTNLRLICAFYKTDAAILFQQHETEDLAPAPEDHPMEPEEPKKIDTLNPLIQSSFLHTVWYNLDRLWKSSNFITDDVTAVRRLRLIQYFTENGSWPRGKPLSIIFISLILCFLDSSRLQLLFACFLAALEVACFTEVKQEQLIDYCNELILSRI